jgi:hypothetical protein
MQCTTDVHDHVADAVFPQPDGFFEHTATFDAAVDRLDAHPAPSELPMACCLGARQRFPTRLLRWLEDVHPLQRERLKAQILQPLAPRRQRIRRGVGDTLVMQTAGMRLTQEQHPPGGIDQQDVFEPMPLVLAAIGSVRFSRVLGAWHGSLGTVMTKRGAPGGGAARLASAGDASRGSGGISTPRWWHKASTRREGASPKARRALHHTGSKT